MQKSETKNKEDVLLLRTMAKFGYSKSPWTTVDIPIGTVVKFVKTSKPSLVAHAQCRYHGNGSNQCRHIWIEWDGLVVPTSVCMEDAALYYFSEVR